MNKETVLITGGTGFVGKNLIDFFEKADKYNILVLVHSEDYRGMDYLRKNGVCFVTTDNYEEYNDRIDYCVHLASYGVAYGSRDIDSMIDVNIKFSSKIAEFCSKRNCKLFINTGSCFEYGTSVSNRLINEKDKLMPDDIYAASKVACEVFLSVFSKTLSLKMVTIRPFSIFGKYESDSRIVPLIFKAGTMKTTLELTPGEQVRDYMFVSDVCDAIYSLIEHNNDLIDGEAINICSGKPMSLKSFINLIVLSCNFDSHLFLFGAKEYRKNESLFFAGDNARLFEIIGVRDYSVNTNKILEAYAYFKKER